MVSAAMIAISGTQVAAWPGSATTRTRIRPANPAALEITESRAATGMGAPW